MGSAFQFGINVHEELAEAPISAFHVRLALLLGALIVFDGYDTVNPSYVVHYLAPLWHLSPSQGGLLVSSGLFGFFIGAAGHGVVADRYGRRGVLLAALWMATVFTVLTPLVGTTFLRFCSLRVLTGIGLGVLMPLATTYMNEFAPRRHANTLPVWGVALGWATGATLASLAGILLTPTHGWQSLFYLCVLALPLIVALHVSLPESAKYLALRSRTAEVKDLLTRVWPAHAAEYAAAELQPAVAVSSRGNLAALLSGRYRRISLTIWLAAFLSLFGVYALSGWIPSVMIGRGETFSAGFGFGAVMQIASFLGAIVGAWLIDRYGAATRWMAALWLMGGVCIALMAQFNTHSLNLFSVSMAGFGIPGAQFLLNNYTARSYETAVRASGVGMELAIGRLGAILGPYVAGLLQQTYHSPSPMFLAVGVAAVAAAVAVLTLSATRAGILSTDPSAGPELLSSPAHS